MVTELLQRSHFVDPASLPIALLAVALVGLSKGGLGGAFALLGVPVLSLVMPPVQAAALLLPLLLIMDAVGLWTWWGEVHRPTLQAMLPAAGVGIAIGWATAAVTTEGFVRLLVGVLALAFVARSLLLAHRPRSAPEGASPQRARAAAWGWGAVSGFTSFVAHAGGPPYQVHVLPMRLSPRRYTGTATLYFAVLNAAKVVPYAALGQFDARLGASVALLAPVAIAGVLLGAAAVKRMRASAFQPFMIAMLALVGVRLVVDGLRGWG
jgi:uncharacterized protein